MTLEHSNFGNSAEKIPDLTSMNWSYFLDLVSIHFAYKIVDSQTHRDPWPTPTTDSAAAAAKSLQLCLTLRDPVDGSPAGSPVPGILQARTLEWGAIAFSECQVRYALLPLLYLATIFLFPAMKIHFNTLITSFIHLKEVIYTTGKEVTGMETQPTLAM